MAKLIKPVSKISGKIRLPASKSYSIRAHFVAACGGRSSILFASDCDDAKVAARLAKNLQSTKPPRIFEVGESGTSLRFLLPLLPLHTKEAIVKGAGTLIGRPNKHLCQSLRDAGIDIIGDGDKESVPIKFNGGQIKAKTIDIDGSVSSQFVSALLIACPRLEHDTIIRVKGKMVSVDYIVMTLQILAKAGVKISTKGLRTFFIKGQQRFKGLTKFTVPSDYGLAAFSLAAAGLLPSSVNLEGYFNDDFIQADGHIIPLLTRMGVKIFRRKNALIVNGPCQLKGGSFNLKDCPDLVPIMAVVAMFAKGKTVLKGIAHARVKESDRIGDLSSELEKVGGVFKIGRDSLTIFPQHNYKSGVLLDSHRDHRLAMAFTVLGSKIGCRINDLNCTHKSYPSFVKDMRQLGLKIV